MLHELAIADLGAAADQLDHQQAGGDEPLAVAVTARVVDLHAPLIEVLHLAQSAGRLDVALGARHQAAWPPSPAAVGALFGDWAVVALPHALKGWVGKADQR